jgi:hypothetical protein
MNYVYAHTFDSHNQLMLKQEHMHLIAIVNMRVLKHEGVTE